MGKPIPISSVGRIEALLAYLIIERDRYCSRVALDALFSPDLPDKVARSNLRQTLARLRCIICNDNYPAAHTPLDGSLDVFLLIL